MKTKTAMVILVLGCSTALMAQETEVIYEKKKEPERKVNTLLGGETSFGGHLGFDVRGTELLDESTVLVGGHLLFNIDHAINIGFAGYGLTSRLAHPDIRNNNGDKLYLDMGYGGLMIEPVFFDQSLVHFTVPVIIGGGWAGMSDKNWLNNSSWSDNWYFEDQSAFFVLEPGINLELNLAKHVRFTMGGSYRFVNGSAIRGTSDKDLSGLSFGAGVRVGWF